MAQEVWKFKLEHRGQNYVRMPAGAEILHVNMQENHAHVWALCDTDPDTAKTPRRIVTVGTGRYVPEAYYPATRRYIGTVHDFPHVWHYFEIKEGPED